MTQPEFLADLGARAARAFATGAATFAVPEFAGVMRAIAQDRRAGSLRDDATRWEEAGAGYHDLVRLSSRYVQALDRANPPLPTVYVAKASGELEPMLRLWPQVLALPITAKPSERELIELRAFPVHLFEIVHEKSFPLEPRVLRRELASSAHLDKIRSKLATGFYGVRPPSLASMVSLEAARSWLLETL